MSKNLVIYYSRKGNNYVNGNIRNLKKGNTEIVAEYIADAVGADLFEVDTVRSYSDWIRSISTTTSLLPAPAGGELILMPYSPSLKNWISAGRKFSRS